ncbi:MAG: AAA family ATPase [Candidatus Wallbacteria bacterium]|nr:AAA family ATPase [Candidatus Wallbacteria bacterium]
MYRKALEYLLEWKKRGSRKPLVIRGARQVGKTYLVRELGKKFASILEINFDRNPEKAELFASRDAAKIVRLLEVDANAEVIPGKTLIFLDEIQAVPDLLPVLRYFHEELPEIHLIAAGSLLDFVLSDHDFPMPVGRVEYLHLGPLDFEEFLAAVGEARLLEFLRNYSPIESMPAPFHGKLLQLLRDFFIVGGMPSGIRAYLDSGKITEANREQQSIIQTFEDDFGKYCRRCDPILLRKTFRMLPALLGCKVKYSRIDPGAKAKAVSDCIHLLELARIVFRVSHSSGNGIPLGAEADSRDFKLLFLDIGLAVSMLGLNSRVLTGSESIMLINSGAIAEQFVGQHLAYSGEAYETPGLHYWNREKKSSSAEVDFLIQSGNKVVPVEVKAGKTGSLRSLQVFLHEKKADFAVRFNTDFPSTGEFRTSIPGAEQRCYRLLSLPLYLICQAQRLIERENATATT